MDGDELNYNNQAREQPGQHSDHPRNFSLHDLLPALTVWACTVYVHDAVNIPWPSSP